ncbi:MAG: ATP-binding protein [Deltaproteobacteria bacterium]|nr:ATP-binding protein [Deltaproteobacteria bacterium]
MLKPKIKEIFVDGYKNLINCKVILHDFNIIVGPNNGGKSNFLEIFNLIRTIIDGSKEEIKGIFRGGMLERGIIVCLLKKYKKKPITISFLVEASEPHMQIGYSIVLGSLTAEDDFRLGILNEELTLKNMRKTGPAVKLFTRDKNIVKVKLLNKIVSHEINNEMSVFTLLPQLYPDRDKIDSNFIEASTIMMRIFRTSVTAPQPNELREQLGEGVKIPFTSPRINSFDLVEVVKKIYENKALYKQFKNVLCQILDLEDVLVEILKAPPVLRKKVEEVPDEICFLALKMQGQGYTLINSLSDGTLIVVAILILLLSPDRKGPLLCIEEPENCLHPKALKTLMTYLRQKSTETQIIATTHSSYILNQVSPENVIIARIKDDGSTTFDEIKNIKELHKRLRSGYINFGDLLETEFEEDEGVEF